MRSAWRGGARFWEYLTTRRYLEQGRWVCASERAGTPPARRLAAPGDGPAGPAQTAITLQHCRAVQSAADHIAGQARKPSMAQPLILLNASTSD